MEKIKLNCAVLCEGKYDKIKLSALLDAVIITTDGFSVFNNAEKKALIRKLCDARGLVIITDSDRAGNFIRSKLKGMLPQGKVKNLYIPEIRGREKRKKQDSKDGLLGVEGMSIETLRRVFEKAGLTDTATCPTAPAVTKAQLYTLGLSGCADSAEKRAQVLKKLDLPTGLTANAMLCALEMLGTTYNELAALCGFDEQKLKFESFFPSSVRTILSNLINAGYEAHFVGGCVRDFFTNRTPGDFDITTNADSDTIIRIQTACGAQAQLTGGNCGTVKVTYCTCSAEITPYRTESGYTDHRHPSRVEYVQNINQDLCRRDFTVNALALTLDVNGNVVLTDNFGGLEDIKSGTLRCIGDPTVRFTEDALRILRALRFCVQLDFKIHPQTADAINKTAQLLDYVSAERRCEELKKMLICGCPEAVLCDFPTVFSKILGNYVGKDVNKVPPLFTKRLFYILKNNDRSMFEKTLYALKLTSAQHDEIMQYKEIYDACGENVSRDAGLELIARHGEFFGEYLEIFGRYCDFADVLDDVCVPKSLRQLDISGSDLAAIGFEGAQIGTALEKLLLCAVCRKVKNKKQELISFAKKLL